MISKFSRNKSDNKKNEEKQKVIWKNDLEKLPNVGRSRVRRKQ
jgi:hypothetical protein